jgi:two-component system, LytTR family, response regulator
LTSSIRTVLIDDEPPARERLASLLRVHREVEIVGEAGDVESAREICARVSPDLIFLDIQLPRGSGFDLLPLLTGNPAVIFVTASDRHALKAFDVNALDYLLKPIHPDRLAMSLSRVEVPATRPPMGNLVALEEARGLRFVSVSSIVCIRAEGNYTHVHLNEGPAGFVRRSLAEWEKLLPGDQFLRLDRSLLIRIDAVQHFRAESRDSASLLLTCCAKPIALGRRAALNLRRAMKKSG